MPQNKRTLYYNLCKELDDILVKSGIKETCTKCSQQQYGGCCHSCKHLSKKGCKIKSLGCRLYLCKETLYTTSRQLNKINKLKRFNEIMDIAHNNKLLIFRGGFPIEKDKKNDRIYSWKTNRFGYNGIDFKDLSGFGWGFLPKPIIINKRNAVS